MKDISAITGAEYAERLLAVNSPTRLIDHLIEKLAAKTGTGWESNLLEFKGSYHKRPDSDDPDSQDCFEWNVMHAFIALANAQGGCVVIGIAETDDHRLVRGDWDPDGILGCRDADGDGKPIPGREEKDLVDHVYGVFFKEKFKRNGRTYKFTAQNKRNPSAPPAAHEFTLDAETLCKLSKLVTFYPCHSEMCSCNALAAIVHPVKKDDDLIEVCRTKKNRSESVIFYRDRRIAKTCELTKYRDIRNYEENREPASSDYLVELKTPPSRSAATSDIYSTMRSYDPNFVGRQKEIDAIRKICTGGKIVLVHAPGGTGKTELALKFAAEDAAQYPGGSFYVPAETAKTWSDILRNLLDWKTSTTGVTPEEWLGLVSSDEQNQKQSANKQKDSQDKSIAKPTYGDSDVVNALIRKTLDRGPMLLVLDNVEAPGDLLATRAIKKVFQQGLPQGLHIIATARTRKGVTDRTCCETTTLSLDDVSTEDALAIINGANEFESEDEKEAARKIIDILDHRALYVARIANLKNDFAERSFSRLLKKLLHDKLEVVKPTSDGDDPRTPTVLWQWTKQAIVKSDKSGKCIKLLQTLALFPADGMSADLLEYFWYSDFGKLDPPATLAAYKEDPDLFKDDLLRIDAYSLIQKDSTSNTLRMHRLDRAAIRRDLEENGYPLRDEIGAALRICPIFRTLDWNTLSQSNSDLLEFCPWDVLNGKEITSILIAHPEYKDNIKNWSILSFSRWMELILAHPEFAKHPAFRHAFYFPALLGLFPVLSDHFDLDDLNGHVWSTLLNSGTPLADACPWERLKKEDWLLLLRTHPEFCERNPHPEILQAKARNTDGAIEFLVSSGADPLRKYLMHDHIFTNIPNEESDYALKDTLEFFTKPNWGELLAKQPSLADKCPWNKLDRSDWISILCYAPQYAAYAQKNAYHDLTGKEWAIVIAAQPSLAHEIPFDKFTPKKWYDFLISYHQPLPQDPPWSLIADYMTQHDLWYWHFPQLVRIAPKFFSPLISLRPKGNNVDEDISAIVDRNAKLEEDYDIDVDDRCARSYWIKANPTLKSVYNLTNEDIESTGNPETLPHFQRFIGVHAAPKTLPCVWDRHYALQITKPNRLIFEFGEYDEVLLPFLWAKFSNGAISAARWTLLDCSSANDPLFASNYKNNLNGLAWAALLCINPSFASACAWEKLNGKAFCLLMINRPSLRKHCDWSKFGGLEWSVLLAENPEFVENCDANDGWSTFSDEDWQYLLDERPWMSKYRLSKASNTTSPSHTT